MAKRKQGYELDLSDSVIDLCCCALGGFVLLLVLVLPEPTKPPSPETIPVKRTLEFKVQLPVMAGVGETPPAEFTFVQGKLFPCVSLGEGELTLSLDGNEIITTLNPASVPSRVDSQCSLGDVAIEIERVDAEHTYTNPLGWIRQGWVDNYEWGNFQTSMLVCKVSITSRPGETWDESIEYRLNAKIKTPKALWPLELLPDEAGSFTAEVMTASVFGSDAARLSNNRIFPTLGIVIRPESTRRVSGMAAVPAFVDDGREWVNAFFLDRPSYDAKVPAPILNERFEPRPNDRPVDWRTTGQPLAKINASRNLTFNLQWSGTITFPEQDNEDELEPPKIDVTFDCTAD